MLKKLAICVFFFVLSTTVLVGCAKTEEIVSKDYVYSKNNVSLGFSCIQHKNWLCYNENDEKHWTKESYIAEFFSSIKADHTKDFSSGEILLEIRKTTTTRQTNQAPGTEIIHREEINNGEYLITEKPNEYINFIFEKTFDDVTVICRGSISDKTYYSSFKPEFENTCLSLKRIN